MPVNACSHVNLEVLNYDVLLTESGLRLRMSERTFGVCKDCASVLSYEELIALVANSNLPDKPAQETQSVD